MNVMLLRRYVILFCIWTHIICLGFLNAKTFEFSSPSSKLVLGDYNGGAVPVESYFKNNAGGKLIGWDQQSIIKGNSQANTFTYAWTCSVVRGTVSANEVTSDLIVGNSNTVGALSPVVKGTSQWVVNNAEALLSNGDIESRLTLLEGTVLNIDVQINNPAGWLRSTSKTVNNVFPIIRGNSQWVVNNAPVLRGTSDWVAAKDELVRTTSNAMSVFGPVLKGTSQWVFNNDGWLRGTSKTVNNVFPIIRGNSQWVVNNARVLRGTSDWVAAKDMLVRTTSNAFSAALLDWVDLEGRVTTVESSVASFDVNIDLIRTTSNAVNVLSPVLKGTSQWIFNNNGWLHGTSKTVNNVFPIIRGNSQWVVNNAAVLRGTSNWVAAKDELARTTSNAMSVFGLVLKGTSQWVFNNDGWLRGTSKTVNNVFPIVRGNSQWIANNAPVLRGTSDWVNAKDALMRTTSNAVNGWALSGGSFTAELRDVLLGTSQWVVNNASALLISGDLGARVTALEGNVADLETQINDPAGWLRGTSNAVSVLSPLVKGTSQWVVNNDALVRTTSNAVNEQRLLLKATSNVANALSPVVKGTSQWVVNNDSLLKSTSNAVNAGVGGSGLSPEERIVLRGTSDWVSAKDALVRTTSNAVNVQWPLLKATSNSVNALSPVVKGTSQWLFNNNGWLRGTSNAVNNVFPIVRGSSQWVVNNTPVLRGTSDWVASNAGLVRTTSNAINTLNDIANRGLGLASRSAADILGLQKGIAQTAFDFTVTSTAEGSYAAGSGGVLAVACNPDGNLLAVAENGNNQSAGIVYGYDNYNLAYMGSVGLRYRNTTFEQSGSSGILPVDIQSYSLAWHPTGEDLLIGGSGHVLTGGFGAAGVGIDNHATSFPRCGLVYRSGVRQNKESSVDQATVTADQAQSWILAGLYTAYNTVSQATNGLRSDYPDLILRAIDYVRAKNYSGVRDIFGDLSATFSENYGATGPAGGTRNWQALNIIGNIQTACDRVALGQMETIPWLMADGLYYIVTCVTGFRGDLCQLTWDCSQGLDQSSRLTAAYAFRAFRLSRSITGDEAFNYACKAANVLFSTPDNGRVNQVAYSKDGQYVAVVGQTLDTSKKQIHIYKSRKFESGPVASYHTGTDTDAVSHISWHPSGNFIAFSSDGSPGQNSYGILQFDGANLFVPQNHELISSASTISGLSWDPTGKYLAVAGTGFGALSIYIYDSYKRLTSISTNALVRNIQPITTVEWSPDGNFLLCGHNGYSLYSLKNGVLGHVETRKGYVNPANAALWFIDGRSFIIASKDLASGNDMQLFTASQDFVNGQMLRTTSNAVNSFGMSGGSFTPELRDVLLGSSQWVVNNDGWLRGTSKTVNNMFPIIRGNSQWVVNNARVLRGTSNWVAAKDMLVRTTSNALCVVVNKTIPGVQDEAKAYSDGLAEFYDGAGSASDALNSAKTYADVIQTKLDNLVSAAGVVGNYTAAGQLLRGTSNWVAARDVLLRTTSNAVNAQLLLLKATSNAVNAENVRMIANESGLAQLRTNIASIGNSSGGRPVNLEVGQNAYVQNIDMSVSPDSLLKFNSLGALNRTINFDGNGHGLFIARNKPGVIQVDAGVNAIVRNAVLSGFDDASVTLGKGARLTFGDGAVVELGSDVAMQRDWECTGRVTVRGFGSALDLSTFSIALKKDANGQAGQLILEDVVLSGVSTNSFNVVDESSVVTLRDVRMNMAGMTTFAHGGLRIERNVTMSGQHAFSFVANNPLNIASNSALNIDSGTVFVYAPASGDRSLLVMKDASSQLILNGSYFYAPAPGIQLSNGTLVVRSNNNIYNHGAKTLADAITFGNGILANNLFIDIQPGASLNVIEGKLDYRNVVR